MADVDMIPAPSDGEAGDRSAGRQIQLLMRKQILLKKKAWQWTLLEILFPLYPCAFLWGAIHFAGDIMPYENCGSPDSCCYKAADPFPPPEHMFNNSGAALAFMLPYTVMKQAMDEWGDDIDMTKPEEDIPEHCKSDKVWATPACSLSLLNVVGCQLGLLSSRTGPTDNSFCHRITAVKQHWSASTCSCSLTLPASTESIFPLAIGI